ncbi:MAG: flagellar motor protein [Sphingomonadaceae bacterium]|jgi:chemotaxis protein MotB|nr:flagellar motor protein MotB [uncultured Sphingomonas sp.]RTL15178.1 MAG: flagellar motor protein [Sphingomonadaceae bacterium]
MARAAPHGSNQPTRIVVKRITVAAGGHHGGAWKVAYADFVTAMMAFFLLLWLLGATTDKQRTGIADYFTPGAQTKSKGAGGSIVGTGAASLVAVTPAAVKSASRYNATNGPQPGNGDKGSPPVPAVTPQQDRQAVARAQQHIAEQLAKNPALAKVARHVRMVPVPEGLRIDLVDDAKFSMFLRGTTALDGEASRLVDTIAQAIKDMPNMLVIRGHTDSLAYGDARRMNNWILSASRAESTRQRLADHGVAEVRFERIEGVADRLPMIAGAPRDERNRRVAILLLYQDAQRS